MNSFGLKMDDYDYYLEGRHCFVLVSFTLKMGVIMINSKRLRYKTDIAGYKINCCIMFLVSTRANKHVV